MYISTRNYFITSQFLHFFFNGHVHDNLFRKTASEQNTSYIMYTIFGFLT